MLDVTEFRRILGDELRAVRKTRGWSRAKLRELLGGEVSLQALATYELGTRAMSVDRLVELCLALGEEPDEMLDRAYLKATGRDRGLRIDFLALATTTAEALAPLRTWARTRAAAARRTVVFVSPDALDAMADWAGLSRADLVRELRRL